MADVFRCILETLSPIHIGCDEVYEPTGFVVDEKAGELVVFDPFNFLGAMNLTDRARFSEICKKGTVTSLLEILQFLQGKRADGTRVSVSEGFVDHLARTRKLKGEEKIQQELNRFAISRTSYLSSVLRPYVPGTSLKGSFRTAYLNHLAMRKPRTGHGKSEARELEKNLLGGAFEGDPFRFVKVSDFLPVGPSKVRIVYALNEKKKKSNFQARGPYQILEVIEPGSLFHGIITVETPLKEAEIKDPISLKALLESAKSFYQKEKAREDGALKAIGAFIDPFDSKSGRNLLRIGRHSGAECVTIEGHREIKIMKGRGEKPDRSDNATTLWLAADESKPRTKDRLRAFGWASLREISESELGELKKSEMEWRQKPLQSPELRKTEPLPGHLERTSSTYVRETWDKATLIFRPGDGRIVANFEGRKAETKDKTLVPEAFHKKLFEKRKEVTATVEVEKYGNAFRIVEIWGSGRRSE